MLHGGWPADSKLTVRSLAGGKGEVRQVHLLGHDGKLEFKQMAEGLEVTLPPKAPCEHAFALKVTGSGLGRCGTGESGPFCGAMTMTRRCCCYLCDG